MKVHQTTFLGTSKLLDTAVITDKTIEDLKAFQVVEGKDIFIPFPRTNLQVNLSRIDEHTAVFGIFKNGTACTACLCCFDQAGTEKLMLAVKESIKKYPAAMFRNTQPVTPTLPQWYYTFIMPQAAFSLNVLEFPICGEIELYIYYSIFLAKQKKHAETNGHH